MVESPLAVKQPTLNLGCLFVDLVIQTDLTCVGDGSQGHTKTYGAGGSLILVKQQ